MKMKSLLPTTHFLDKHLKGRLRIYYLGYLRGKWIKSYRVRQIDVGEGTSVTMLRYVIEVRHNYRWYEARENGNASCEENQFKALHAGYFRELAKAHAYMISIVKKEPNRELFALTELLEKELELELKELLGEGYETAFA